MVLAVKQVWQGKTAGAPNMQPYFFGSATGLGSQSLVTMRPGQYHAWVHAACQAIIQPAIDLPVVMYQKKDEKKLIPEHPIIDLMRKPNPFMSGTNFFEAIIWDLLLTTLRTPGGQAFVIGEKPTNFRKGEIPKELWIFSDEVVTAKLDSQNVLIGWTIGFGAQVMELTCDQVIRINLFNPYNWKQGLAPLAAALVEVEQDALAKEFNTSFLKNGAQPSGMVSLDGSPPDKQIWESIRAQFTQQYAGQQNAGKTMFLPWMLKFEQFTRSHLDFAYMEQLNWNKDTVLAVYRVNKWAIGDSGDLNYATAKEATRQLFERAIKPIMRTVMMELNEGWIRYIDKRDLRIKVDYSTVEALKEDRSIKIKDAAVLIQDGLPPAAAWEYVGLDIPTKGFAWLMENQSLAGQLAASTEAEAVAPKDEKPPKPVPKSAPALSTKDERQALSKFYIDKVFAPGEKELLPVVTKFLTSQRNALQENVAEVMKGKISPKDLSAKQFTEGKKDADSAIIRAFQPVFMSQVKRTLRQVTKELTKKSLNLDSTEEDIREFLKTRLLNLSQINDTSFEGVEAKLSDIITAGIDSNMTMPELGKAIEDGIFEVYQGRLKKTGTIARTETATITSGVRHEVFQSAGITRQEWLTAHDSRVRESHIQEDGNIVNVGEAFPETHLRYPCDPNGEPGEVINCRCVALPVEES